MLERNFELNDKKIILNSQSLNGDNITVEVDGKKISFKILQKTAERVILKEESFGREFSVSISQKTNTNYHVLVNDTFATFEEQLLSQSKVESSQLGGGKIKSPMPGKIFKVLKKIGDSVVAGDTILILEAMKMEHAIKANISGKIKNIFYSEGKQVDGQSVLVELEA